MTNEQCKHLYQEHLRELFGRCLTCEMERLQSTLRVVAGLIHDALPSAQGTAAESLAHAYEAIETTLVGVVAHEPSKVMTNNKFAEEIDGFLLTLWTTPQHEVQARTYLMEAVKRLAVEPTEQPKHNLCRCGRCPPDSLGPDPDPIF